MGRGSKWPILELHNLWTAPNSITVHHDVVKNPAAFIWNPLIIDLWP